jgi:hypothetical protein
LNTIGSVWKEVPKYDHLSSKSKLVYEVRIIQYWPSVTNYILILS